MKQKTARNAIRDEAPDLEGVPLTYESVKTLLGMSDDMVFKDIYTGEERSVVVRVVFTGLEDFSLAEILIPHK